MPNDGRSLTPRSSSSACRADRAAASSCSAPRRWRAPTKSTSTFGRCLTHATCRNRIWTTRSRGLRLHQEAIDAIPSPSRRTAQHSDRNATPGSSCYLVFRCFTGVARRAVTGTHAPARTWTRLSSRRETCANPRDIGRVSVARGGSGDHPTVEGAGGKCEGRREPRRVRRRGRQRRYIGPWTTPFRNGNWVTTLGHLDFEPLLFYP